MQRIHLYVPSSWKSQHRGEEHVGSVKLLQRKHWMTDEDSSLDVNDKAIYVIRLPVKLTSIGRIKLKNAIENHFRQRCYCEHDCCGCWFGGVRSTNFLNKRDIVVHTSYSRNV